MDEAATEGIDIPGPAMKFAGQFHDGPIGDFGLVFLGAPVPAGYGVGDQSISIVSVRDGEQENTEESILRQSNGNSDTLVPAEAMWA